MSKNLAEAIGELEIARCSRENGTPVADIEALERAVRNTPATTCAELAWKLTQTDSDGDTYSHLVNYALNGHYQKLIEHIGQAIGRPPHGWVNAVLRDAKGLRDSNER